MGQRGDILGRRRRVAKHLVAHDLRQAGEYPRILAAGDLVCVEIHRAGERKADRLGKRPSVVLDEVQITRRYAGPRGQFRLGQAAFAAQPPHRRPHHRPGYHGNPAPLLKDRCCRAADCKEFTPHEYRDLRLPARACRHRQGRRGPENRSPYDFPGHAPDDATGWPGQSPRCRAPRPRPPNAGPRQSSGRDMKSGNLHAPDRARRAGPGGPAGRRDGDFVRPRLAGIRPDRDSRRDYPIEFAHVSVG